jgi:predicted amidohydrolase
MSVCVGLLVFGGSTGASEPVTFKLACLKLIPVKWDRQANFEKLEAYARKARAAGADFIVTPEGYMEGYVGHVRKIPDLTRERILEIAEPPDGPYMKKVSNLARELKVWLLVGMTELRDGNLYNSAFLFSSGGECVGRYAKSHTGYRKNERYYTPGDEFPVFDTPFGKIGIVICYDRKHPEAVRILAVKGAQVILVPAYGDDSHEMSEDILMRTRAYENGVYAAHVHPVNTLIADPEGTIIAQAKGFTEEIVMATIVLDDRVGQGAINTRRPEIYGEILKKE